MRYATAFERFGACSVRAQANISTGPSSFDLSAILFAGFRKTYLINGCRRVLDGLRNAMSEASRLLRPIRSGRAAPYATRIVFMR